MSTLVPYEKDPTERYQEAELGTIQQYNEDEVELPKQISQDTYGSRIYMTISGCCDRTSNRVTTTARRVYSWAVDPDTRCGFALIFIGACCAVASVSLVGAYEDCLESNSDKCNKETTRTTCTKNKKTGRRTCTTRTTTHEEDLLNNAIGFGCAAFGFIGAGIARLVCGVRCDCDCDCDLD